MKISQYVKACEFSDVPPGTIFPVDIDEKNLMVVNLDGKIYILDRMCTHETADLSNGFLTDAEVTCPLHLSRFNLKTGAVQNPPARIPLKTYDSKIEGTAIYVLV